MAVAVVAGLLLVAALPALAAASTSLGLAPSDSLLQTPSGRPTATPHQPPSHRSPSLLQTPSHLHHLISLHPPRGDAGPRGHNGVNSATARGAGWQGGCDSCPPSCAPAMEQAPPPKTALRGDAAGTYDGLVHNCLVQRTGPENTSLLPPPPSPSPLTPAPSPPLPSPSPRPPSRRPPSPPPHSPPPVPPPVPPQEPPEPLEPLEA